MSDVQDPSRESLALIVRALVERHGGPTKVAGLVDVERTAIHRWMKGDVSIHRLALLAERLNEPLVVRFGPGTTKEPPPEWTGVLMTRDELRAYVDTAKGEVLNAIDAGRIDLIDAIAQRVAELAAQRLDKENDDEGHDGNPDRLPGPQEPPPVPEP